MRLESLVNRFGMGLCLVLMIGGSFVFGEGLTSGEMNGEMLAANMAPVRSSSRALEQAKRELNFDQEIKKQEKKISLRYRKGKAPKYTEVKYYRFCRQFKTKVADYDACNKALEKKRYAAWRRYWSNEPAKADPSLDSQVAAGQLEVTLQPKALRVPANSLEPK